MQLQPRRPPGRIDRKAAAYALEIVQLRSAGYTYEAIREALADVGIVLSTSALRREVRRLRSQNPPTYAPTVVSIVPMSPAKAPVAPPRPPEHVNATRGRDVAEAFFTANPSNHLLRTKETS